MKILVDGDSCPVKDIIIRLAKEFSINVTILIDSSHYFQDDYCTIITIDKGRDAVDYALINRTSKGDIVITGDYGVATMALSKQAFSIHPNGLIYTSDNIDKLLMQRHLSAKARRVNKRYSKVKKRTAEDDVRFEHSLRCVITKKSD